MIEHISRRDFMAAVGLGAGALTLGVRTSEAAAGGFAPSVYLSIAETGLVTIVVHRSEMGQGVRTALPMIICEELEASWEMVRVEQATGDPIFGNQNTDGSRSVRGFFDIFRLAGASAREMLIAAAAKKWRVPASRLVAREHAVHDPTSKKMLGFGELAALAAELPVPSADRVKLKKRGDFHTIGTSRAIVDGPDIVTGAARFGADVSLPGMLIAVIERPPAVGAELASADEAAALRVPGVVKVVTLPIRDLPAGFAPLGGVAVLATNTWAAMRGRSTLAATWKESRHDGYTSTSFRKTLEASAAGAGAVARKTGDPDKALAGAAKRITADYYAPHLAQAPMEPPVALAEVKGDRCEVWTSVQTPQSARSEVASALGLAVENVTINVTLLGGGFGRKSKPDFVVEAALLSREAKAPVRVQWTREDDLRHGFYHTVSAQTVEGGLDANGKVVAWVHKTAFPPIGGTFGPSRSPSGSELGMGLTDLPFAIPNVAVLAGDAEVHVRTGWMRSVANIYHAFAVGSFVDELAAAAKRDPRDLWLELCAKSGGLDLAALGVTAPWNYGETSSEHAVNPSRLANVIREATVLADWSGRRAGGAALGLSAHRSFASYVATVIEVSGTADGFRIERATSVIDAGQIVSRDRVLAQLEGAIAYGLSAALYGEISASKGRIEQSNFHDYKVLRINEAPRVVNVEVLATDAPPGGVGEPGMPPVAPALANALFALTGTRGRELPLSKGFRLASA